VHCAEALRHLLDVHAGDEVGPLRGGGGNVKVLLIMAPDAKSKRAEEQREHRKPEQPASAAAPLTRGRRPGDMPGDMMVGHRQPWSDRRLQGGR